MPSLRPLLPQRRLLLAAALSLLAGASGVAAQDVTRSEGTPEDVGMSAAILETGVHLYREALIPKPVADAGERHLLERLLGTGDKERLATLNGEINGIGMKREAEVLAAWHASGY
ncbi:MAG: hypothetical protein Q8N53_01140 [Longimicrobiales bacterium]|nr:hypothetical protein [Longimicrobiales bacterium]